MLKLIGCLATCLVVGPAAAAHAQLALRVVASGLSRPVQFVQDPARPGVQLIVQQGGLVRVLLNGTLQPTPFLDLSGEVSDQGEQGLLGLAFAPDYASSRRFFVNFSNREGHTVIARFTHLPADPLRADPSSRFDLRWPGGARFIVQPFANHNGGTLLFGSDGYLYIGMGDGGGANDPGHRAQDPATLLGKMLRLDVAVDDGHPDGYRIPEGNPFAGGRGPVNALAEIWGFGFRNPFRFSQDSSARGGTDALIVGDVGQGGREEIDYEPAGAGGRNYGWRNREGSLVNVDSLPPAYTPLVPPVFEYGREEGRAITGGVVYRGSALPVRYRGRYFYADFVTRRLWSLGLAIDPDTREATVTDREEHTNEFGGSDAVGNVVSIDIDTDGELHLVDWSGRVLRVELRDADGDGLPDEWERDLGIDPASPAGADGAAGDPDGDGKSNAEEYAAGTHPRGFFQYFLAEGAASGFFDVTCAVANANAGAAHVLFAFDRTDGHRVSRRLVVPARGHARRETRGDAELADSAFGITIESDVEVAVDRTMRWRSGLDYGAHAETATPRLASTWYFAEGATHAAFNLFYLLSNPHPVAVDATVTYLRPAPLPPLQRTYRVPAASRYTVWVDVESAELAATDVAAIIETDGSTPIVVERAMYWDAGRAFEAGHGALGLSTASARWYLAEGATGDFFDTFVLVANPGVVEAVVDVEFLLPDGTVVRKAATVAPRSRLTLWVDALDPQLSATGFSAVVESRNDVPIVVERAMWWPGPTAATWLEAHASGGVASPAARWLFAGGASGGPPRAATYVLIANTAAMPVSVQVTVLFEDRPPQSRDIVLPATSRFGAHVADLFPDADGSSYGVLVEAADGAETLIVERATYWDVGATFWGAGVNAVALPLR